MEERGESKEGNFVRWFSELNKKDVSLAGGKGASLAEMYNKGFQVPPGFVITSEAYNYFIEKSGLASHISRIVKEMDTDDDESLQRNSKKIMSLIENSEMPKELEDAIVEAYDILDVDKQQFKNMDSGGALSILKTSHEPPFVAVRNSVANEKMESASHAGLQESYLNIKGTDNLIESVKKTFSSLYTPRAIHYRKKRGISAVNLGVVVQKMVDSNKSGVMYSKNPMKDDRNILIEAAWGLGNGITSGKVSPDQYTVDPEYNLVERKISDKKFAITRNSSGDLETVKMVPEKSKQEVLTGHEIKMLAQIAAKLEEHYNSPQDIEFAIDSGKIHIVQSRPITNLIRVSEGEIEGNVLASGFAASPGLATGTIRKISNSSDLENSKRGEVLVCDNIYSDMIVGMQKAAAVISNEGGVTSRNATLYREMGIPAVLGASAAMQKLQNGQKVTVDGFTGRVLEGKGEEKKVEIKKIVPTKTRINVNVNLSEYADRAAESGATGVGLVRLEVLVANSGKHLNWFIRNEKLDEYISVVHASLKKIAVHFDELRIRTSDVRSDLFNNLEGAPKVESNPILGNHGIRFSLKNQDLFEAELKAIKELVDEFPNKKFGVIIPQIISVKELKEAKRVFKSSQFPENVMFGIMVETPAAVQIINDLCEEGLDFICLGVNDLTQYTLAIDKDNDEIKDLYDEMNLAVLNSMRYVIRRCKRYGVETSIGGGGGNKEEVVKFLVEQGIDSVSVDPEVAHKISQTVSEIEQLDRSPKKEEKKEVAAPVIKNEIKKEKRDEELILEALGDGENGNEKAEEQSDEISTEEVKELFDKVHREDEYMPSLDRKDEKSEVPPLNEAIPVGSDQYGVEKEEEIVEIKKDKEVEDGNEETVENGEVLESDQGEDRVDRKGVKEIEDVQEETKFEDQPETELDKAVVEKAAEFEEYQKDQEKQKTEGTAEKKDDQKEQFLDIF
jgi:pyruvate, water dikinase